MVSVSPSTVSVLASQVLPDHSTRQRECVHHKNRYTRIPLPDRLVGTRPRRSQRAGSDSWIRQLLQLWLDPTQTFFHGHDRVVAEVAYRSGDAVAVRLAELCGEEAGHAGFGLDA